jgi:hypothetical protein
LCRTYVREVTRARRELNKEGIQNLHSSKHIIRVNEMVGVCKTAGEEDTAYIIQVGKPEGGEPLARLRCRCRTVVKVILK